MLTGNEIIEIRTPHRWRKSIRSIARALTFSRERMTDLDFLRQLDDAVEALIETGVSEIW